MHSDTAVIHAHPVGEAGSHEVASTTTISATVPAVDHAAAIVIFSKKGRSFVDEFFLNGISASGSGLPVSAGADGGINEDSDVLNGEELGPLVTEVDVDACFSGRSFIVGFFIEIDVLGGAIVVARFEFLMRLIVTAGTAAHDQASEYQKQSCDLIHSPDRTRRLRIDVDFGPDLCLRVNNGNSSIVGADTAV